MTVWLVQVWRKWLGGSRAKICPRLRKSTQRTAWHAALCRTHCFTAMKSTCQRTERMTLIPSLTSAVFLSYTALLWRGHQTALTNSLTGGALWENPAPCLSCSCVPQGGGVSERVEVGSPDWEVLKQWELVRTKNRETYSNSGSSFESTILSDGNVGKQEH